MEPLGFCLLTRSVIFNSSHAKGGNAEGPGRKVGFLGGGEATWDHGIGSSPFRTHGEDELEPSSHGPPLRGGPGSTYFSLFCAFRSDVHEGAPPRVVDGHCFEDWVSSRFVTCSGKWEGISPCWILVKGDSRLLVRAEVTADANIVWLRTLLGEPRRLVLLNKMTPLALSKYVVLLPFGGRTDIADANIVWLRTLLGKPRRFVFINESRPSVSPGHDGGSVLPLTRGGADDADANIVWLRTPWGKHQGYVCGSYSQGGKNWFVEYLAPVTRVGASKETRWVIHNERLGPERLALERTKKYIGMGNLTPGNIGNICWQSIELENSSVSRKYPVEPCRAIRGVGMISSNILRGLGIAKAIKAAGSHWALGVPRVAVKRWGAKRLPYSYIDELIAPAIVKGGACDRRAVFKQSRGDKRKGIIRRMRLRNGRQGGYAPGFFVTRIGKASCRKLPHETQVWPSFLRTGWAGECRSQRVSIVGGDIGDAASKGWTKVKGTHARRTLARGESGGLRDGFRRFRIPGKRSLEVRGAIAKVENYDCTEKECKGGRGSLIRPWIVHARRKTGRVRMTGYFLGVNARVVAGYFRGIKARVGAGPSKLGSRVESGLGDTSRRWRSEYSLGGAAGWLGAVEYLATRRGIIRLEVQSMGAAGQGCRPSLGSAGIRRGLRVPYWVLRLQVAHPGRRVFYASQLGSSHCKGKGPRGLIIGEGLGKSRIKETEVILLRVIATGGYWFMILQKRMVRKERTKRLNFNSPYKERDPKMAKTGELEVLQGLSPLPEDQLSDLPAEQEHAREFFGPTQAEEGDMGVPMMLDSPKPQRAERAKGGEEVVVEPAIGVVKTEAAESQASGLLTQDDLLRTPEMKRYGSSELLPGFGSYPEGSVGIEGTPASDEVIKDWKIPSGYRLDWISARVEAILFDLAIVGGMYTPVFVEPELAPEAGQEVNSPVRPKVEVKEGPGNGGLLSFFKLRLKKVNNNSTTEEAVAIPDLLFPAEVVKEDVMEVVEVLNQAQEDRTITGCLGLLKQVQKEKVKINSFSGKTAGLQDLRKLWEYGIRKLALLATERWKLFPNKPVMPLIREIRRQPEGLSVHLYLLSRYENALFRSFTGCIEQEGKKLAVEYWAAILDAQCNVAGKKDITVPSGNKLEGSGFDVWGLRKCPVKPIRSRISSGWGRWGQIRLGWLIRLTRCNDYKVQPFRVRGAVDQPDSCSSDGRGISRQRKTGCLAYMSRPLVDLFTIYAMYRFVSVKERGRDGGSLLTICIVSERMAELLIKELLQNEAVPRDVRISQMRTCVENAGSIQARLSGLISKITRSSADKDLKEMALAGASQLSKDCDAYTVSLNDSIRYLEGGNRLPPAFKQIYSGTESAVLPASIAVWDQKTEYKRSAILNDLMMQEFWAQFFKAAKGNSLLYITVGGGNFKRGGGTISRECKSITGSRLGRIGYKQDSLGRARFRHKKGRLHSSSRFGGYGNELRGSLCKRCIRAKYLLTISQIKAVVDRFHPGARVDAYASEVLQGLHRRPPVKEGMGAALAHMEIGSFHGNPWIDLPISDRMAEPKGEDQTKDMEAAKKEILGRIQAYKVRIVPKQPHGGKEAYSCTIEAEEGVREYEVDIIQTVQEGSQLAPGKNLDIGGLRGLRQLGAGSLRKLGINKGGYLLVNLGILRADGQKVCGKEGRKNILDRLVRWILASIRFGIKSSSRCRGADRRKFGARGKGVGGHRRKNGKGCIRGNPLEVKLLCTFRGIKMSDITAYLTKVMAEAANRGQAHGLTRKEAIAWCKANLLEDFSGMHRELNHHLVERHNLQVIRFETSSLVQAVKVAEITPLAPQHNSCVCWNEAIIECGLCEYSSEDRAFVAGLHHRAASALGGTMEAVAITMQFDKPIGAAVKTAVAGSLLKLFKILTGIWEMNTAQRATFQESSLKHHKMVLIELNGDVQGAIRVANMVTLTWAPFLRQVCGFPELLIPDRVFISIPASRQGSYFVSCTEWSSFKDGDAIRSVFLPPGDFPRRGYVDPEFRAKKDEPFARSLENMMAGMDEVLDRLKNQMAHNKKLLKKTGVLQGPLILYAVGSRLQVIQGVLKVSVRLTKIALGHKRGGASSSGGGSAFVKVYEGGNGGKEIAGGTTVMSEYKGWLRRMRLPGAGILAMKRYKRNMAATEGANWAESGVRYLKILFVAISNYKRGQVCKPDTHVSERMTLFNLHLFDKPVSQWDKAFGAVGGAVYRQQEARLAAFLDAFDPHRPEDLDDVAQGIMKARVLENSDSVKAIKLEKVPDECYPSNGFRAVWEPNSFRKVKDFRSSLRINLRDKVGTSKAIMMRIEDAQVNGDRVAEISLSLPRNLEDCSVAGQAKQAIAQSARMQNAPKWLFQFVKLPGARGFEPPGVYISVICPKIKDGQAFQEYVFKSFPELAGGQLSEWQTGEKKVLVRDTTRGGTEEVQSRKAFFTKICIPLAVHYAGSGTVALDRRAPDTQWLTFESSAYSQYLPCKLCQACDGHYAMQVLERPKGQREEILVCPHKGTCPDCGEFQAAFLYGGHVAECTRDKAICGECKETGAPADHKPMDLLKCRSYRRKSEGEMAGRRAHQAAVNKAFESLLSRAIAGKGKDFAPYLEARREASLSKAKLNDFYKAHEELGNFEDQLRAMAPGNSSKGTWVRNVPGIYAREGVRKVGLRRDPHVKNPGADCFSGDSKKKLRGDGGLQFCWILKGDCLFRLPDEIEGRRLLVEAPGRGTRINVPFMFIVFNYNKWMRMRGFLLKKGGSQDRIKQLYDEECYNSPYKVRGKVVKQPQGGGAIRTLRWE